MKRHTRNPARDDWKRERRANRSEVRTAKAAGLFGAEFVDAARF